MRRSAASRRPLGADACDGRVDGAAGVEGIVGYRLEDTEDALGVGDDEERDVIDGKLTEERGINDERGSSTEIVGCVCCGESGWRGVVLWGIRWEGLG